MATNMKWLHEVKPDKRPNAEKTPDELMYETRRMSFTFRTAGTFYNTSLQKLIGLGAPTDDNEYHDDHLELVKAFGEENKRADFKRNEVYCKGFWAMATGHV